MIPTNYYIHLFFYLFSEHGAATHGFLKMPQQIFHCCRMRRGHVNDGGVLNRVVKTTEMYQMAGDQQTFKSLIILMMLNL